MDRMNANAKGSLSQSHPGAVEDYTKPFLYTFAFWVFCALTLIWALWGFLLAIVLAVIANHVITLREQQRAERIPVTREKEPLPPR